MSTAVAEKGNRPDLFLHTSIRCIRENDMGLYGRCAASRDSRRSGLERWIVMFLAVCLALCGAGCQAQNRKAERPTGQDTPGQTLEKWHRAALDGDKKAFLECYYGQSSDWLKAVEVIFEFGQAVYGLHDKLLEAYGEDAVEKFRAMKIDGTEFTFLVSPRDDPTWVSRFEISVTGDKAEVKNPFADWRWPPPPWPLKRVEAIWAFDLEQRVGTPRDAIAQFGVWIRAIEKTSAVVGKPHVELRDVKKELMKNIRREAEAIRGNRG